MNSKTKTHGDFEKASTLATGLKEQLRFGSEELDPVSRETLDQICSRMARIVCGEASHRKHWKDIIGFCEARLEAETPIIEPRIELEIEKMVRQLPRSV